MSVMFSYICQGKGQVCIIIDIKMGLIKVPKIKIKRFDYCLFCLTREGSGKWTVNFTGYRKSFLGLLLNFDCVVQTFPQLIIIKRILCIII